MTSIEHISEKPWSAYTEADYTLEQWHRACLVHQHTGPPTSKTECKLPVKTPNGAVNRNAVHSALAALHGARAPLQASNDEKMKAESALRRLYRQIGEKPPSSLGQSDLTEENIIDFIEHHGTKGMRWGVRKSRSVSGGVETERTRFSKAPKRLSSAELEARIKRMENEKKYNSLNKRDVGPGQRIASEILGNSGKRIATTIVTGTGMLIIKEGLKKHGKLSAEQIGTITGGGKKKK